MNKSMETTQNNSEVIFEPFPKPNTIPEGWDISAIPTGDGKKTASTENSTPPRMD